MKKMLIALVCCFLMLQSFGQTGRKLSAYLLTQYNHTLYDYTIGNNPWGMGFGFQAFLNTKMKFRPTLEITGDAYFYDDKVFRANPDGTYPKDGNDLGGMINTFAGCSFHPAQSVYLSFTAGPSFISQQTFLGIKPSFGFYFSKTQRWMGKISYFNIFNRTKIVNEDFGSLSFSIGHKLF